jgi:hypothetical protein
MKNLLCHSDLFAVGNHITDNGDPEGRDAQTGLGERVGYACHGLIPCVSCTCCYVDFPNPSLPCHPSPRHVGLNMIFLEDHV